MKRLISLSAIILFAVCQLMAFQKLTIADITSGKFAAAMISEIRPVPNTDQYACVSDDQTRIDLYSFKTSSDII